jgi:IS4 transposase
VRDDPAYCEQVLLDGSYLSRLYADTGARRNRRNGLLVRAVDYRLEGIEGAAPLYRLVTTILDPAQAPAAELAALYHERWEVETALDELKTHLRGRQIVLREPRRRTWIRCSALIVRAKPSPSTYSSPAN